MGDYSSGKQKAIKDIQEGYGWYFLVKDVADYLSVPFMEVMHTPVVEVLPIILIMQRKTKLTELLTPKPK